MKHNHALAMEYIARLLRSTITANGPLSNHKIQQLLRRDAVKEFEERIRAYRNPPGRCEVKDW